MGIMRLLVCLILLAVAAPAQHMNEKDSPCANVAVTVDLSECLAKAHAAADARLNDTYRNVRERLEPTDLRLLVAAQRLWLQYRDANCVAERELYGAGTGSHPAYLACMEAMTRARTRELAITYTVKLK